MMNKREELYRHIDKLRYHYSRIKELYMDYMPYEFPINYRALDPLIPIMNFTPETIDYYFWGQRKIGKGLQNRGE